jgi:prefoldin subunit 5
MDEFITLQNQAWEIENEIQSIKRQISAIEVEAIEKGLTEGTVYKYTENAGRYHYMLPANGRWFTLVKITPKKVRLHIYGDHIETTYLVDKSQFIYQIKNRVISEVNN